MQSKIDLHLHPNCHSCGPVRISVAKSERFNEIDVYIWLDVHIQFSWFGFGLINGSNERMDTENELFDNNVINTFIFIYLH